MSSWTIYGVNGVAKAVVKELELHDEWMAECFVTVTVKSHEPIDFEVGDYIDYRGERYSINYDPTILKKARRGSYGEGFVYDNIKFVSVQDEIARCDFNDIVLADNNIHYTMLPTFPFYCETVDDLLDRIQANLEELYPGGWTVISPDLIKDRQRGQCVGREQDFVDAYNQYIGEGSEYYYEKTGIALTADNNTCWEALSWANTQFKLNFVVRGRVVVVGTAGSVVGRKFRYGKGNGLYEIERISDSEQKIITRLRGYGAETNLPNHYYANLSKRYFARVIGYAGINNEYYELDIKYNSNLFKVKDSDGTHYVTRVEDQIQDYVNCYILAYDTSDIPRHGSEQSGSSKSNALFYPSTGHTYTIGDKLYYIGGIDVNQWPADHTEQLHQYMPDNMAINRLMLPGFPVKSLADWVEEHMDDDRISTLVEYGYTFSDDVYRPYIDSPNKAIYGIRPASIYFDGSDDNEDIHPTIEEMRWDGRRVDVIVSADKVEDNGILPDNAKDSDKELKVVIPYAGFKLDELLTDEAAIEMKDGMCGARKFKLKKAVQAENSEDWVCTIVREYDETLKIYFPYSDFQIYGSDEPGHSGDHFVLTGIDLPDSYIEAASEKLFFATVDALMANHAPRYTYQPRIDEIWMQRQHDTAISAGIPSFHDTLKSGDLFSFADDDLGIDAKIIIDILTIKENGNNGIPTYEITLRDEKVVSALDKRLEKISSVVSSVGGVSAKQYAGMIAGEGSEYFLSKVYDDVAQGVIGFAKGVWFGVKNWFIDATGSANLNDVIVNGQLTANHAQSTNYTGDGMFDTGYLLQYAKGKAKLVIDNIVCRGKFIVNEIEDRIWTYAGGNLIFSAAGSTIFYVEYLDASGQPLGYTYINSPWLLKKIPLLAGIIAWSKRRQMQRALTPEEKARVVKFRCYETSDDGTMQTRNWWQVNDLAYCQTLNRVKNKTVTSGGYSGSLSNTVYVRRVAGIGSKKIGLMNDNKIYDYVDLWNIFDVKGQTYIDKYGDTKTITDDVSGYDEVYNDWPAAGDVIVQRGNVLDEDRQGFSTVEVTGTQRGYKVYDGVNDYSMENKKQAFLGFDADKGRAQLDVFGDCYIGSPGTVDVHDGSTYIRYNSLRKKLEVKAEIDLSSTFDGQAVDEYVDSLIHDVTDAIQTQVDQKAETWYQADDPAADWTTAQERNEHIGDLWHNTTNNKTFYYGASGWVEQYIPDDVFDTIDGKASVYISQPSSYKANDLWILSAQTTLNGITYKKGEMLTASSDSETFVASHWSKKVIYTDDEAFLTWKAQGYANDLTNTRGLVSTAQNTADGAASAASTAQNTANSAQNAANAAQQTATSAKDAADALAYVKTALKEHTTVQGGLVLATLIGLRSGGTTYAGINGAYQSGDTIAAWFGGGMDNNAKIVFRMNGSGHMAGGNIKWDTSGNAEFAGKITATEGSIGGFTIGANYLGTNSTASGNTYISKDGHLTVSNDSGYAFQSFGRAQLWNSPQTAGITIGSGVSIETKSGSGLPITITSDSDITLNSQFKVNSSAQYNDGTGTYVRVGQRRVVNSISDLSSVPSCDYVIMASTNQTLPTSGFKGQHLTIVNTLSSSIRVQGSNIYGYSTNKYFNMDGYEICDAYYTGSKWIVGFSTHYEVH